MSTFNTLGQPVFGVGNGIVSYATRVRSLPNHRAEYVTTVVSDHAGAPAWLDDGTILMNRLVSGVMLQLGQPTFFTDQEFSDQYDILKTVPMLNASAEDWRVQAYRLETQQFSPYSTLGATAILARAGFSALWLAAAPWTVRFSTGASKNDSAPLSITSDTFNTGDRSLLLKGYPEPVELRQYDVLGGILGTHALIAHFSGEAFAPTVDHVFQRDTSNRLFLNGALVDGTPNCGTYQWFWRGHDLWLCAQGQQGYAYSFALADPTRGFLFGSADAFNPSGISLEDTFRFATSTNPSERPEYQEFWEFTAADIKPWSDWLVPVPPAPVVPAPSTFSGGDFRFVKA